MEIVIASSPLNSTFIELMAAIQDAGLRVVIGGGYGLFLKHELIRQHGVLTILPAFDAGERSTEDIDMFLDIEVIAQPEQAGAMRQVLMDLGFVDNEGAQYYQFIKQVDSQNKDKVVKVDSLTGPVPDAARARVRIEDNRRVRPMRKGMQLHAHTTPEALGIRDSVFSFDVASASVGKATTKCSVSLPQPFTYAMMKVKSYHDKMQRDTLPEALDLPGKHAWDVFRILAMTTEAELAASRELSKTYRSEPVYAEVAGIVSSSFGGWDSPATLRATTYGRGLGINVDESSLGTLLALLAELLPLS